MKKLSCGYTLQSDDVLVLYRDNSIRTSSVTAATIFITILKDLRYQLKIFKIAI